MGVESVTGSWKWFSTGGWGWVRIGWPVSMGLGWRFFEMLTDSK